MIINNIKILKILSDENNKNVDKYLLFFNKYNKDEKSYNWILINEMFSSKKDLNLFVLSLKEKIFSKKLIFEDNKLSKKYTNPGIVSNYLKVKNKINELLLNIDYVYDSFKHIYVFNKINMIRNESIFNYFQDIMENNIIDDFTKEKCYKFLTNSSKNINVETPRERKEILNNLDKQKFEKEKKIFNFEKIIEKVNEEYRYLYTQEFLQDFENTILEISIKTRNLNNEILKFKKNIILILKEKYFYINKEEFENLNDKIKLKLRNYIKEEDLKNDVLTFKKQTLPKKEKTIVELKKFISSIDKNTKKINKKRLIEGLFLTAKEISVEDIKKRIPYNIYDKNSYNNLSKIPKISELSKLKKLEIRNFLENFYKKNSIISNTTAINLNISMFINNLNNSNKELNIKNLREEIDINFDTNLFEKQQITRLKKEFINIFFTEEILKNIKFFKENILMNKNIRLNFDTKLYLTNIMGIECSINNNYLNITNIKEFNLKNLDQFDLI